MGSSTRPSRAPEPLYKFTAEQVEALNATRAELNFTPEEGEEILGKNEATIEWIAAAETLQEQQRRGAQSWARDVERPRMTRRIATARRSKTRLVAVTRPRSRGAGRPRARAARSCARSGDSPDSDLDEPAPDWHWAHPAWGRSS